MTLDDERGMLLGELACLAALTRRLEVDPPTNAVQADNARRAVEHQRGLVKQAEERVQQARDAALSRPITSAEHRLAVIESRREAV